MDERIVSLLIRWQERWELGEDLPASVLVDGEPCSALAEELERGIKALRSMNRILFPRGEILPVAPPAEPVEMTSRYRNLRFLDRGGHGLVWLASDEAMDRDVVLKVPVGRDSAARVQFIREAKATGQLQHPGIVPVHGIGCDSDGGPVYSMRRVDGEPMVEAIRHLHGKAVNPDTNQPARGLRELLGRFIAVCRTVAYAHSQRRLHCDLKPGNVLLGVYGETIVVDWGLVKPSDGSSEHTHGGTLGYRSPEQAKRRWDEVRETSDVYALGATLFHILTGEAPADAVARESRGRFFPRGRTSVSNKVLEQICRKAMSISPADRYKSASALAADVQCWLDYAKVSVREPIPYRIIRWARKHRTFVSASLALLLTSVVALSIGNLLVVREQRHTAQALARAEQGSLLVARAFNGSMKMLLARKTLSKLESEALRLDLSQIAKTVGNMDRAEAPMISFFLYNCEFDRRQGLVAEAEANWRKATELNKRLPSVYVSRTPDRFAVQITLNSQFAMTGAALSKFEDARAFNEEAIRLSGLLPAADRQYVTVRDDLAESLLKVADLNKSRDPIAARSDAMQAITILESVVKIEPAGMFLLDLAQAHGLLAGLDYDDHIFDRSVSCLDMAQEFLQRAGATGLDKDTGELADSFRHYQSAVQELRIELKGCLDTERSLYESLNASYKTNDVKKIHRLAQVLEKYYPKNPGKLFDAALAYAKCAQFLSLTKGPDSEEPGAMVSNVTCTAEALEALKLAVEHGFDPVKSGYKKSLVDFEKDPALSPIRSINEPAWNKLIESLHQKSQIR